MNESILCRTKVEVLTWFNVDGLWLRESEERCLMRHCEVGKIFYLGVVGMSTSLRFKKWVLRYVGTIPSISKL